MKPASGTPCALRGEGLCAGVVETFHHDGNDEVQFRFIPRSIDHELSTEVLVLVRFTPAGRRQFSAAPCWQAQVQACVVNTMKVDRFQPTPRSR